MTMPIRGIFVPHPVPLDAQDRIDEDELRRLLAWLIEQGVDGLYPNGSTGEFTRFTPSERRRIVEIACEVAAGRVPVLAGAAEANVRETLSACEAYAACGARAVAIVSPFYYRLGAPAVEAYFREIAASSPIDVTLYNIPMFASPIDVPTIARLAELPRIVGIKDSSGDIAYVGRVLHAVKTVRPEFSFLCGWEPALLPALLLGADGGTHASAGVVPEVTGALYRAATAGDWAAAREAHYRLLPLFDAMLGAGDFPLGFRLGVECRGFRLGASRQPLGETVTAGLETLASELAQAVNRAL